MSTESDLSNPPKLLSKIVARELNVDEIDVVGGGLAAIEEGGGGDTVTLTDCRPLNGIPGAQLCWDRLPWN